MDAPTIEPGERFELLAPLEGMEVGRLYTAVEQDSRGRWSLAGVEKAGWGLTGAVASYWRRLRTNPVKVGELVKNLNLLEKGVRVRIVGDSLIGSLEYSGEELMRLVPAWANRAREEGVRVLALPEEQKVEPAAHPAPEPVKPVKPWLGSVHAAGCTPLARIAACVGCASEASIETWQGELDAILAVDRANRPRFAKPEHQGSPSGLGALAGRIRYEAR